MSELDEKTFWDERFKKYSHTGWANYFVYNFDQHARIKAIEKLIERLIGSKVAVDFGAGSGDFSTMLSKKFESVKCVELAESARYHLSNRFKNQSNISVFPSIRDAVADLDKVDLFLSITVFGHVLNEEELRLIFRVMREKMNENSRIICMEYGPKDGKVASEYQRFRSISDWKAFFKSESLNVDEIHSFDNPYNAKSITYQRVYSSFYGKVFRRLSSTESRAKLLVTPFLWAFRKKRDYLFQNENEGDMKIFILKLQA